MAMLLLMQSIYKSFPGVKALENVDFEVFRHEIVGLVGENGAGKSTLMKILCGVFSLDRGQIVIEGREVNIKGPRDAQKHGIGMVFQEQSILPNMRIYENIFLGHEEVFARFGITSRKAMVRMAREVLDEVEIPLSPEVYVHELSFVQRQMIEIARNIWLSKQAKVETPIIILDEPTTVLEQKDIELLFYQLKELKKRISLIYISHRLKEIVELCDRVYVLKDGVNVGCFGHQEVDEDLLRSKMVGKEFHGEYYLINEQRKAADKIVLELKNCSRRGAFRDVSFQVNEGEIVSLCGTIGSGKEALCSALYGMGGLESGEILVNGKKVAIHSPAQAFSYGIGYIPEDRKSEGLVLNMPLFDNMTLPIVHELKKGLFIDRDQQLSLANQMIQKLNIKTPSPRAYCLSLSGGNQQKVVLSKWLLTHVKILIMSHPTRGVDVGAKREIYHFMREMAQQGMAMIVMGDSFEEDIGLANRIIIMRDREISAIIDANDTKPTPSDLIQYVV
ncbi:MAG TPA: sugar ABC transporter ATP-binding protein [Atribacteraceae bacterium]|nr:sugar ABC transporter ATP-binding protein [Atribacteraceae bacterium]